MIRSAPRDHGDGVAPRRADEVFGSRESSRALKNAPTRSLENRPERGSPQAPKGRAMTGSGDRQEEDCQGTTP